MVVPFTRLQQEEKSDCSALNSHFLLFKREFRNKYLVEKNWC